VVPTIVQTQIGKTNDFVKMWTVILLEVGEEPIIEQTASFSDAWALAQPFEEDGLVWTMIARETVMDRFEAGSQEVLVGTGRNVEGIQVAHTLIRLVPHT
jgi:hypothetical protein